MTGDISDILRISGSAARKFEWGVIIAVRMENFLISSQLASAMLST